MSKEYFEIELTDENIDNEITHIEEYLMKKSKKESTTKPVQDPDIEKKQQQVTTKLLKSARRAMLLRVNVNGDIKNIAYSVVDLINNTEHLSIDIESINYIYTQIKEEIKGKHFTTINNILEKRIKYYILYKMVIYNLVYQNKILADIGQVDDYIILQHTKIGKMDNLVITKQNIHTIYLKDYKDDKKKAELADYVYKLLSPDLQTKVKSPNLKDMYTKLYKMFHITKGRGKEFNMQNPHIGRIVNKYLKYKNKYLKLKKLLKSSL